jgi:hypothetical protein
MFEGQQGREKNIRKLSKLELIYLKDLDHFHRLAPFSYKSPQFHHKDLKLTRWQRFELFETAVGLGILVRRGEQYAFNPNIDWKHYESSS